MSDRSRTAPSRDPLCRFPLRSALSRDTLFPTNRSQDIFWGGRGRHVNREKAAVVATVFVAVGVSGMHDVTDGATTTAGASNALALAVGGRSRQH